MEDKKTKILNTSASIIMCIAIMVFILTFSIGLPIYIRPFYYMQIDSLDIVEDTGFTEEQIRDAFDEVMDYLTLPGKEFGTGDLKYSEDGKAHFVDCRFLFQLNFWALLASSVIIAVIYVLKRKGLLSLSKVKGYGIPMLSGSVLLGLFSVIGALIAVDFDSAFTVFHKIFFPGKSNWIFSAYEDEIIMILPSDFFMNCAILICASILILSVGMIISGIVHKRRQL